MIILGYIGDRVFFLNQNPLTKKITLEVNWLGTNRKKVFRSKRMILHYLERLL